jgi:hypothetical protein
MIWIIKINNFVLRYPYIFGVENEILSITKWDIKLKIFKIVNDCVNIFKLEKVMIFIRILLNEAEMSLLRFYIAIRLESWSWCSNLETNI